VEVAQDDPAQVLGTKAQLAQLGADRVLTERSSPPMRRSMLPTLAERARDYAAPRQSPGSRSCRTSLSPPYGPSELVALAAVVRLAGAPGDRHGRHAAGVRESLRDATRLLLWDDPTLA
jgi:hypothetical protein